MTDRPLTHAVFRAAFGPDDLDDDPMDLDDDDQFDCGRMADGSCSQAGSEHCDFDCPYRDR